MAKTIVTGIAGFNNLREPRGFKGEETKRTYGMDLLLTVEEAEKFLADNEEAVNKLHAEMIEREKARGKKVLVRKPINTKDTPEGMVKIAFKRKEEDKAPMVLSADNEPYTSFLKRGAKVKIAYDLTPYVMQGVFGVSLKLIAVQVLEEELNAVDVAKLFDDDRPAGSMVAAAKPVAAAKDLF